MILNAFLNILIAACNYIAVQCNLLLLMDAK